MIGKSAKRPDLAERWVGFVAENSTIIEVVPHFEICRDPDDNKYLDCAVEGKAKCVVSGDKDLLTLECVRDIPIVAPHRFVEANLGRYPGGRG